MKLEEREQEGVEWIHLAIDRDQWHASVFLEIDLRILYNVGLFFN